jgi:hypothetical protein
MMISAIDKETLMEFCFFSEFPFGSLLMSARIKGKDCTLTTQKTGICSVAVPLLRL